MILCFDQYFVRNRVLILQKWKISSKLFSYNKNMTYYDARNIIFFACFLIAPKMIEFPIDAISENRSNNIIEQCVHKQCRHEFIDPWFCSER